MRTDRLIDRHAHREMHGHTGRLIDRPTNTQPNNKINKYTHRQERTAYVITLMPPLFSNMLLTVPLEGGRPWDYPRAMLSVRSSDK